MSYNITNLFIGYKNKLVVENINLEFNQTGIYYLVGENGSGKTTFILTLNDIISPLSGSYDARLKNGLFFLQDSDLYDNLDGYSNIRLIAKKELSYEEMKQKAENFNISDILHRKVKNYSYGERMRLLFTSSLFSENNIIYFDEIDKGIDTENLLNILEGLKILSKTKLIIMTTHRENKLYDSFASKIYFGDNKVIVNNKEFDNSEEITKSESKSSNTSKNNKLLKKALFAPIYSILLGIVLSVLSILTIFLFSGSNYKTIDINKELGSDIINIQSLNIMMRERKIIDEDVKDLENVEPYYFSFANTEFGEPPIYLYDDNNEYLLSPDAYVNTDFLGKEKNEFIYNDNELIFYANKPMIKYLHDEYKITTNIDILRFEFKFNTYDEKLDQDINFQVNIKVKKLDFNDTQMNLKKIYYSGTNFVKHSSENKITVEDQEYEFLKYIRENRISNSYSLYQMKANEELRNQILSSQSEGTDYLNGYLKYSNNNMYTSYINTIHGNQLSPRLFLIFGSISLVINSIISALAVIILRKKKTKSFLLSLVFKYDLKSLKYYLLNFIITSVLILLALPIAGIIWGIITLFTLIPLSIFIIVAMILFIKDIKHPYQRLICQRKTSGVD